VKCRSFLFLAWPFNKTVVKSTKFVLSRTYGVYGGLNWVTRMGIGISVRLYRINRHHLDAAGRHSRLCCFRLYCMHHCNVSHCITNGFHPSRGHITHHTGGLPSHILTYAKWNMALNTPLAAGCCHFLTRLPSTSLSCSEGRIHPWLYQA
jgi:hypothetical protein